MNEEKEKLEKYFEQRLTSNKSDILILDENNHIITKENLEKEALKKLEKYKEKLKSAKEIKNDNIIDY